jgi:DNA-binding LytR/AlgR family response regulator
MEKTKILIVEDQILIAEALKFELIKEDYEVTDIADSAEKALASFKKTPCDLILMDVRLNGSMDGIQAAKKIKEIADIPVIFVTDFKDEFTFKNAKESKPSNYITKPYVIDDVLRAIELALMNASSDKLTGETPEYIFIPEGSGSYKRIKVDDILWIEADRSYSKIETVHASHVFTFPLNKVLEQINSPRFVRVHRSYAVNLDKVEAINGNELILPPKGKIQMSSNFRTDVLSKLHFIKGS